MINGDVKEFLKGIASQNYTILYDGFCFHFQAYDLGVSKTHFEITCWSAYTIDHQKIIDEYDNNNELANFSVFYTYDGLDLEDCLFHFLSAKIWDNGKNFWEVQEKMEWLD